MASQPIIPNQVNPTFRKGLEKQLSQARQTFNHDSLAIIYRAIAEYDSKYNPQKKYVLDYFNRSIDYYKLSQRESEIIDVKLLIVDNYIQNEMLDEANTTLESILENKAITPHQRITAKLLSAKLALLNNDMSLYGKLSQEINNLKLDSISRARHQIQDVEFLLYTNQLDDISEQLSSITYEHLPTNIATKLDIVTSDVFFAKNELDSTQRYLNLALDKVDALPLNRTKQQILQRQTALYEAKENYDSAYYSLQLTKALSDSLMDRSRFISVNTLSSKMKDKENKTEIKILELEKQYAQVRNEQQRRAVYVLSALLISLAIATYFLVRFYRQRIETNAIITKQNEALNEQNIEKLKDDIKLKSMHSMIEGQEKERERISKDLHDSLGGLLSSIKLKVDNIPLDGSNAAINKQSNIITMLDSAVNEIRNISGNLQPTSLKNLGLVAAINDLINSLDAPEYPDIEFQHYDVPKLPTMTALSIYRIVQELLYNSIKHAKADEIFLQLRQEDTQFILQYEDDGVGFDLETLKQRGMGLENITSRVNYLKGEISIDARVDEGVSYLIYIDL